MFIQPRPVAKQDLTKLIKKWLPWGLVSLGVVMSAVGFGGLIWQTNYWKPDLGQISDSNLLVATASAEIREGIMVDVSGAVREPGLYQLETGERLAAALAAAQGLTSEADPKYVSEQLNLASVLSDGQKLYIPFVGETVATNQNQTSSTSTISINHATQSQLEELAGVGEKRASDIIQNRPYASLNELLTKNVLTETVFSQNLEKLAL